MCALCVLSVEAGLGVWGVASPNVILFALVRSLYGALGSAAPPAVQAYIAARTDHEERTQALSLVSSSFGLGTVIGPAVAPFFILPIVGLAGPLPVFAVIGLILLTLLLWRLPPDPPRLSAPGAAPPNPTPPR